MKGIEFLRKTGKSNHILIGTAEMQVLATGMSIGSAAAFMITGSATKITNLGALKTVLGIKNLIIYWVFIILFSCISGLLINLVM